MTASHLSRTRRGIVPGALTQSLRAAIDYRGPYHQSVRLLTIIFPLTLIAVALLQPWAEPRWLFMDTITAVELSGNCCKTYFGAISNLGIMLWSATAAICLFAGLLLLVRTGRSEPATFALSAALFTGWLAMDDAFLFHEKIAPKFGIEQNWVLAGYLAAALLYGVINLRQILKADVIILALGATAMLASLFIDVALHSVHSTIVSVEDSAKFIGICAWAAFHVSAMFDLAIRPAEPSADRIALATRKTQEV